MSYADFLASKRRKAAPTGISVDPDDLHPKLFPTSARITAPREAALATNSSC